MIRRWAKLLCIASALGLASCADAPRQKPGSSPFDGVANDDFLERSAIPPKKPEEVPINQGRITRIPLGTFFQLQQSDKALIFDVRPGFYYSLGHVPGAINWPRGRFEEQLSQREAQKTLKLGLNRPIDRVPLLRHRGRSSRRQEGSRSGRHARVHHGRRGRRSGL